MARVIRQRQPLADLLRTTGISGTVTHRRQRASSCPVHRRWRPLRRSGGSLVHVRARASSGLAGWASRAGRERSSACSIAVVRGDRPGGYGQSASLCHRTRAAHSGPPLGPSISRWSDTICRSSPETSDLRSRPGPRLRRRGVSVGDTLPAAGVGASTRVGGLSAGVAWRRGVMVSVVMVGAPSVSQRACRLIGGPRRCVYWM